MKKIKPKHIASLLHEATKDVKESELPEILKDIVALIAKHRLTSKSQEIIREFYSIYNADNGIEEVTITRTERLGDVKLRSFGKALAQALDVKEVFITEKVDERLLAGMKIETGSGLQIDATLAGRISQLRKTLTR